MGRLLSAAGSKCHPLAYFMMREKVALELVEENRRSIEYAYIQFQYLFIWNKIKFILRKVIFFFRRRGAIVNQHGCGGLNLPPRAKRRDLVLGGKNE